MERADFGRFGRPFAMTERNSRYNLLLYLIACKSYFLVLKYINVTTVRSNNPDADCHPGFLVTAAILTVKE